MPAPQREAARGALCPPPGAGMARRDAPDLMGAPTRLRNAPLWAAAWARRQSPVFLPCGGFANIACVVGKILDGSLSDYGDPATWPTYAVRQLPREEFYKVQAAYDAWNAAHGKAPPGALASSSQEDADDEKTDGGTGAAAGDAVLRRGAD